MRAQQPSPLPARKAHGYTAAVSLANTLYPRLFLPYAATLVLVSTLAWWIAIQLLTSTLEQRLEQQLDHATEVLAQGRLPLTPDLLERLAELMRARILLLEEDGRFTAHPPFTHDSTLQAALQPRLAAAVTSGTSNLRLQSGDTPYLAVLRALPEDGQSRYRAVAAITSLADVRAATRRTAWWLGGAALIGTLVLAWLGHRVARSITVPIGQLVQLSERIASGDRTARVNLSRDNEIGTLARALNRMAEHLQVYEQEAADQNRLATLGEMAARVAHEIRNPLTAIRLQLQLLGESLAGREQPRVARLLGELDRLELIVSGTLTMARPQHLRQQPLALPALVREVCDLMAPQLAHRHIDLEQQAGQVPELSLDGDRVKQVVFNLLANAADALPAGGTIRVRTAADATEVILTVEDSGPGITPEQRERIFSGAGSGKANSLGVGLLLCRELVELHGGRIEADASPGLGGARFRVRLPRADMPE
jgi:signal transduction histidine kinase